MINVIATLSSRTARFLYVLQTRWFMQATVVLNKITQTETTTANYFYIYEWLRQHLDVYLQNNLISINAYTWVHTSKRKQREQFTACTHIFDPR